MNNRIKNRTTGCTENSTGKLLSRCKADRKAKEIHTRAGTTQQTAHHPDLFTRVRRSYHWSEDIVSLQ